MFSTVPPSSSFGVFFTSVSYMHYENHDSDSMEVLFFLFSAIIITRTLMEHESFTSVEVIFLLFPSLSILPHKQARKKKRCILTEFPISKTTALFQQRSVVNRSATILKEQSLTYTTAHRSPMLLGLYKNDDIPVLLMSDSTHTESKQHSSLYPNSE